MLALLVALAATVAAAGAHPARADATDAPSPVASGERPGVPPTVPAGAGMPTGVRASVPAGAGMPTGVPPTVPAGAGTIVPLEPCRLVDTRTPPGASPTAGAVLPVAVAGRCGVPEAATAVAVTVTAAGAGGDGFVSVFPAGAPWPGTSTLNVAAGEIRANGALVGLGGDGAISVLVDAGGHVVVDVSAAVVPTPSGVAAAGRFVPVTPQRLVDTRGGGRPAPGGRITVPLPPGVPGDASAIAVNLTTTGASGFGFFTAFPAGGPVPEASVLTTDRAGQARAASAIVPVSAGGLEVLSSAGDHVIVDLAGYVTGPGAPTTSDGLFVPAGPARIADTRADPPRLYAGGTREWATAGATGQASAVVANVTMVEASATGWTVAYPARTTRPEVSTVNAAAGETVANLAFLPVSSAGVAVHASSGTEVLVDVTGWFTGSPEPALLPPPENVPTGPGPTLIVGDSVAAAFRWATASQQHLSGFPYQLDVRTCRTTTGTSCSAGGGTRPPNALTAIATAPGPVETLVMMTGYNDWHTGFAAAVDAVMDAARARGARQVVWLTLRTTGGSNHVWINAHLAAATARHPDLRLADWNAHTVGRGDWFASDGVHLTARGADGLARFITAVLLEP